MEFCPECGCQLDFTKGVVSCTHCTYSECHCELCSIQDDITEVQTGVEQKLNSNIDLKGGDKHVE